MIQEGEVGSIFNLQHIDYQYDHSNANRALMTRSKFTYNGGASAATILVSSGQYWCKDKFSWWDAQLTSTQAAGGTPTANDWYYLYLDYSAITEGTKITNAELIWSTTAPSWSETYAAWMNGDDRCIFACRGNAAGNNFLEFFHDGDLILFADDLEAQAATDIDTTWIDVDMGVGDTDTLPAFVTRAELTMVTVYVDALSVLYWRTNGQSGTSGHEVSTVKIDSQRASNTLVVITDSSQIIEIKHSASNANTTRVEIAGWYLPTGM